MIAGIATIRTSRLCQSYESVMIISLPAMIAPSDLTMGSLRRQNRPQPKHGRSTAGEESLYTGVRVRVMSVDMCMILNGIVMIFLSKWDIRKLNIWRNDKPSPCAMVDRYLARHCLV